MRLHTESDCAAERGARWIGFDVGPKSITEFSAVIANARTVIWNGENSHMLGVSNLLLLKGQLELLKFQNLQRELSSC